jgi:hypothetical protein
MQGGVQRKWTRRVDAADPPSTWRGHRTRVVTKGLDGEPTQRRIIAMACLETFLIPALQATLGNDMFELGQGFAACRNVSALAIHQCAPHPNLRDRARGRGYRRQDGRGESSASLPSTLHLRSKRGE